MNEITLGDYEYSKDCTHNGEVVKVNVSRRVFATVEEMHKELVESYVESGGEEYRQAALTTLKPCHCGYCTDEFKKPTYVLWHIFKRLHADTWLLVDAPLDTSYFAAAEYGMSSGLLNSQMLGNNPQYSLTEAGKQWIDSLFINEDQRLNQ